MVRIVGITFFSLLLCGCSANSLNSNAKSVRVTNSEPRENCKFIDQVTGSQGNYFTGGWTSNKNLEQGAINDLRNETAKIGGNTVVILTQRSGQTGSSYNGSGSSQQTNVIVTGSAYNCQ